MNCNSDRLNSLGVFRNCTIAGAYVGIDIKGGNNYLVSGNNFILCETDIRALGVDGLFAIDNTSDGGTSSSGGVYDSPGNVLSGVKHFSFLNESDLQFCINRIREGDKKIMFNIKNSKNVTLKRNSTEGRELGVIDNVENIKIEDNYAGCKEIKLKGWRRFFSIINSISFPVISSILFFAILFIVYYYFPEIKKVLV